MYTIAIDGMGGDYSPNMVIEGMDFALQRHPQLRFLLYGDEPLLTPALSSYPELRKVVTLCATDEVIAAEMKPSVGLRLKKSSMRMALQAVASGDAHGVVSAGNTGAYLLLCKMILKTLHGIDRPAIASQLPTLKGESVMLDLGANIECSARNLIEFAIMGSVFAQNILSIDKPSIGLLNIGSEAMKGPMVLQEAAHLLKEKLPGFFGFVEGNDVTGGAVDVIVADGFAGNVALKTGEGVVSFVFEKMRRTIASSLLAKIGFFFMRPSLRELKSYLDPRRYNGALWLGLNGTAVKSHGGTDALGFAYAIEMAVDMIRYDVNEKISQTIGQMQEADPKLFLA